jgi:hypothetical protein
MALASSVPIETVDMSYIDALIAAVKDDDAIVVLARKYHNGDQDTYMTDRVKVFLDLHTAIRKFNLNVCRTITLAVKDELSVSGFNTSEIADAGGVKAQAAWAWDLWTKNRMDAVQAEVHESALSDRETFIIVDFDYARLRPRLIHNYKYTSLDAEGDGQGCWMLYENDDVNQPARCAVKQWIQTDYDKETGQASSAIRRTIYYPDRIEKWTYSGAAWEKYIEPPSMDPSVPPEPWPIPWLGRDGKPVGIAVIHFRNVNLTPEAWDAIPIQDAINKTLIDILASNDLTAFQMLVALGWYPTTDGEAPKDDKSNLLKVGAGQWIGTQNPDGKLQVVTGSDPTPLVDALKDLVLMAAQVTSTPTARFTTTKLIASAETLKEQNAQLKKKAQDRRTLFGDAWEACMEMARKVANMFGNTNFDELITFSTIWSNNETLDDLKAKLGLGVPEETIWNEAGYTQEQITNMKRTDAYRLAFLVKLWPMVSTTPEAATFLAALSQEFSWLFAPMAPTLPTRQTAGVKLIPATKTTDVKPVTTGEKPKGQV